MKPRYCLNATLVPYMGEKKQLKFKAHELGENEAGSEQG